MSLSPQWLDELRARVSLSGVIGRTTRLTKAGHEFKACCPFHSEKTPSFTVNDGKGFYHCFGCGAHGDVIRWMTDQRGLNFMVAVKELAAEAGMEMPTPDPRAAEAAERRDTLHDVMAAAQAWFAGNLAGDLAGGGGEKARAYLAKRGIDAAIQARFGFGYAPDDRQALKAALVRFPEEMLIEAGLRIAVEDREPYDRFRDRLMLPIEDSRGRVIAFGGRVLDEGRSDAPKYLNSPDTPLFDKGATLYNLHRAAPLARPPGRLIVVEGYMDVIALAAAGIGEVVAPMGTALTERQIELLWRQVETPILCFDGDAAGERAAIRAATRALPILRPSHSLKITRLPSGLDPDDLVRRQGPTAIEALLGEAPSLVDTLWQYERDAQVLATPEEKAGLKARLVAHVDSIADADIRALYRRELLDRFSAHAFPRRDFTRGELARASGPRKAGWQANPMPTRDSVTRLRHAAAAGGRDGLCAVVIAGLVRWPGEIARHAEPLARASALDPRFGALLDALDLLASGETLESETLRTILARQGMAVPAPEDYAGLRFGFLAMDADTEVATAELRQAIGLLVERPELDAALAEATGQFDRARSDDEYAEAWAEQQRLLKRKLEFDGRVRQMASRLAANPQAANPQAANPQAANPQAESA